jgi:hypothetical protein
MSKDKDVIAAFIQEMKARHSQEIDSVALPAGTQEYVAERMAAGDTETLLFMLKLGYVMGLQTGFAAGESGQQVAVANDPWGPLKA